MAKWLNERNIQLTFTRLPAGSFPFLEFRDEPWLPRLDPLLEDIVKPIDPMHAKALACLPYFVEWRPRLWVPAVRWLLGDPARFQGKKVLEMGCGSGRMSCLFGWLGAQVLGVDLPGVSLEQARREAERLGVGERVRFLNCSADPGRPVPARAAAEADPDWNR